MKCRWASPAPGFGFTWMPITPAASTASRPSRCGPKSSFIVNGRIALTDIEMNDAGTKLQVALWARNLLNEAHVYRRSAANSAPVIDSITGIPSYSGVLGDYGNFNAPRTFGIEASVSF